MLDKIFFASKYILIKRELAKFEIKISGSGCNLIMVHWHTLLEQTIVGRRYMAKWIGTTVLLNRQIVFDVL